MDYKLIGKIMANFQYSLKITLDWEKGYAFNPNDPGGETYCGVSRNNNPNWKGWLIIDNNRNNPEFPDNLYSIKILNDLLPDFYRINYWDKIQGDLINNQEIANKIFDVAVNCGVRTSSFYTQKTLAQIAEYNFMIDIDGIIGPKTLECLNNCFSSKFLDKFRELVLAYYKSKKNADEFIDGWKRRLYS